MSKAHRLKTRKQAIEKKVLPLAYLLKASDADVGEFELARLDEVANLRKEMLALFDRIVDVSAQAVLVAMLRGIDRQELIRQLLEPSAVTIDAILADARAAIRDGQRSPEELLPRPSLPAGAAHLAAAVRYQERQIADGLCSVCPKPLDPNSVRFCTKHLAAARTKSARRRGVKGEAGSRDYLYGEISESTHGRTPGTLASLAMSREKKTRALLAELGIKPESAAVGLKAAKEAILRVMPDSKAKAMTGADLFRAAIVPSLTTGNKALRELVAAGEIQRIGKPRAGVSCRYFRTGEAKPSGETASSLKGVSKPKHLSRTKQNSALLKMMRGEETNEE